MTAWIVYLSLCLLFALSGSEEINTDKNAKCGVCPDDWSAYGCRCFKFSDVPKTWMEGERECLALGGNLASIHSLEEYIFLQSMIRYITQASPPTWIGGHDAVEEGSWLWTDGTIVDYLIWSPEQPDNFDYENCLLMNYEVSGNMNDGECFVRLPYLCAKESA